MRQGEIIFQKYKFIRFIKDISKRRIYLVEHQELGSKWIVKEFDKQEPEYFHELSILKKLSHPGIPMIIDVVKTESTMAIVQEYVQGQTLEEKVLKEGTLKPSVIRKIGQELARIISYLHETLDQPLIHRDIKPSNVIMDVQGNVQLIDFGIARFYKEEATQDTTYLGTKGFAAPEQYGLGQSDERTDIFGIGSTLYYLMTGKVLARMPYGSISHPMQSVHCADKALKKIVGIAIQWEREKRYASAKDLLKELEERGVHKKNDKVVNDYLDMNRQHVLRIWGGKEGVGVTYMSLRIAWYLMNAGCRVLVIDESKKQAMKELGFDHEGEEVRGMIYWKEIPILVREQKERWSAKKLQDHIEVADVIIIDGGTWEERAFEAIDQELILMGVAPWEQAEFEEFVLDHPNLPLRYGVRGCHEKLFKSLDVSMRELELFLYNVPEMYWDQDGDRFFYENMLSKWGWIETCSENEKKGLFLEVEHFKKRFQNGIKSLH